MSMNNQADTDGIIIDDLHKQQPDVHSQPTYVREINKLSNTVISSATVALIRAMLTRPSASTAAAETPAANLPPWYADQYKVRASWQAFLRQYGRDTLILTGVAYLMDGVEYAVKSIRGTDNDPANKMIGGVVAGGVLGVAWYPANSTGRAVMSAAGALVGYMSYSFDKTTKAVLLEQQRKLEKELLKKGDAEIRTDLDPPYLRHLLRMKQQQLVVEHKHEQERLKQEHQQWMQARAQGGSGGRPASQVAAEERRGWAVPSSSNTGGVGSPDQGSSTLSTGSEGGGVVGPGVFSGLSVATSSSGGGVSPAGQSDDVLRIDEGNFEAAPKDGGEGMPGMPGAGVTASRRPTGSGSRGNGRLPQQQRQPGEWLVLDEEDTKH